MTDISAFDAFFSAHPPQRVDHQRLGHTAPTKVRMRAYGFKEQRPIDCIDPEVDEGGEAAIGRDHDQLVFHMRRAEDLAIRLGIPFVGEAVIVHIRHLFGVGGGRQVEAETGRQIRFGQIAQIMSRQRKAVRIAPIAARFDECGMQWIAIAAFYLNRIDCLAVFFAESQRLALARFENGDMVVAEEQIGFDLQIEKLPMRGQHGEGTEFARRVRP